MQTGDQAHRSIVPGVIPQSLMFRVLISLISGATGVLAFAPYGIWPLLILAVSVFFLLVFNARTASIASALGYAFGVGLFGAGVYWVYYSLHLFGAAIAPVCTFARVFFSTLSLPGVAFAGRWCAVVRQCCAGSMGRIRIVSWLGVYRLSVAKPRLCHDSLTTGVLCPRGRCIF